MAPDYANNPPFAPPHPVIASPTTKISTTARLRHRDTSHRRSVSVCEDSVPARPSRDVIALPRRALPSRGLFIGRFISARDASSNAEYVVSRVRSRVTKSSWRSDRKRKGERKLDSRDKILEKRAFAEEYPRYILGIEYPTNTGTLLASRGLDSSRPPRDPRFSEDATRNRGANEGASELPFFRRSRARFLFVAPRFVV